MFQADQRIVFGFGVTVKPRAAQIGVTVVRHRVGQQGTNWPDQRRDKTPEGGLTIHAVELRPGTTHFCILAMQGMFLADLSIKNLRETDNGANGPNQNQRYLFHANDYEAAGRYKARDFLRAEPLGKE